MAVEEQLMQFAQNTNSSQKGDALREAQSTNTKLAQSLLAGSGNSGLREHRHLGQSTPGHAAATPVKNSQLYQRPSTQSVDEALQLAVQQQSKMAV